MALELDGAGDLAPEHVGEFEVGPLQGAAERQKGVGGLQDQAVLKQGVDGLMARQLQGHQGRPAGELGNGGAADGEGTLAGEEGGHDGTLYKLQKPKLKPKK
jgi:hypothetical protein